MSNINLPVGAPFRAAVINTDPKQLRFIGTADQAYQIRLSYIAVPPVITSNTQTLYIPDEWSEGLYLKFVEKTALAMGDINLSAAYKMLYDRWLSENKFMAKGGSNKKHTRLKFSWL